VSAIRVKAIREEFDAAISDGCVYGEVIRQTTFYVYVELGKEIEYNLSPKDDPNTEYKMFISCNVFFTQTQEQLDREEYVSESLNSTVIIYT
jgi:hypothetical protein